MASYLNQARRAGLSRLDTKGSPYLYILPFYLLFAAFGLFPLLYTAYVSFNDWDLLDSSAHHWIGLANYVELVHDPYFWNALGNTLSIWLLSTVPQLLAALWIAHLLNHRLRARTALRMGVLLPNVTSIVAVTIVFTQLFGRDFGMVNWILGTVGIGPVDWQANTWSSHLAIAVIVGWRWTGYNALIYLAGMQAIPNELYESAAIDGASRWRQFREVTIPSLRPTIIFTIVISTIGSTQLFGEPLLFSSGGTNAVTGGASRQYQTLAMYFYERGFNNGHLGRAAAVAWLMFLVIVIFVVINTLLARRVRDTE